MRSVLYQNDGLKSKSYLNNFTSRLPVLSTNVIYNGESLIYILIFNHNKYKNTKYYYRKKMYIYIHEA